MMGRMNRGGIILEDLDQRVLEAVLEGVGFEDPINGTLYVTYSDIAEKVEADRSEVIASFQQLALAGAMRELDDDVHDPSGGAIVTPKAKQLWRKLQWQYREAAEPPDIVDQMSNRFRRHKVWGVCIVAVLVIYFLLQLINVTLSIVGRLFGS